MNEAELDMIFEVADSFSVIVAKDGCPENVQRAACEAIQDSLNLVHFFRRQGIRSDLVHAVYEKRMELIKKATTVAELREIAKPAKPHYTGNGFVAGEYDVPEEEMIFWSLASLKAPLVHAACERYAELFRSFFGADAYNELMSGNRSEEVS